MPILLNRLNVPSQQSDRSIIRFAQQFIRNVKDDIHDMITDTRTVDEGYAGLDSERDTEEQVETAIRCGIEVLARRDERFEVYPIQCLITMKSNDDKFICNVKAVSFVPLFARLAIEFALFEEHERGGLLIADEGGHNALQDLTYSSHHSFDKSRHHKRVDTSFHAVLVRLHETGLFTKDDIQQYELVHSLCENERLALQRFSFLTKIDPASLLYTDEETGSLPWHWAADTWKSFGCVCVAVFLYYPKWKGIQLLHQIDTLHEETPFQVACEYIGYTAATRIVETTLAMFSETVLPDIPTALILAASEERVHVECVYFLLRRQPNVTISILQQHDGRPQGSALSSSNKTSSRRCRNNNSNIHNRIVRRSTRTRKRNNWRIMIHNITNTIVRRSTRKRKRN